MNDSVLRWRAPAADWIDAAPIGDGRLGAKVFGRVDCERLALNLDTLWSGRPQVHGVVDGPATFQAVRERLLAGERAAADALVYDLEGPHNHAYQPLGDLTVEFVDAGATDGYTSELDLATGVASCEFRRGGIAVRRRVFVSRRSRALVVAIDADAPVGLRVGLTSCHPVTISTAAIGTAGTPMLTMTGFAPATIDPDACLFRRVDADDLPGLRYGDDGGVGFAVALQVDAAAFVDDEGGLSVVGDRIRIVLGAATTYQDWSVAPSRDVASALEIAVDDVARAGRRDLADLLADQEADHGELYNRVRLELDSDVLDEHPTGERVARVAAGEEDVALWADLYNFARYLLISSSRPGTLPATLQGIWNDARHPPWFSSYTLNINAQMNYWLAEPGNLAECAEPLLEYVESLSEAGVATAREVFGLDGWCANHNADVWRATWPVGAGRNRPTWALAPTCGMWAAAALAEHDAFHPDDDFVRDRAFRVFEGAARFALDLIVQRPGQRPAIVPSTSPENNYRDHAGAIVDCDVQTTYDLCVVRETFDVYLAFAARLSLENDLTEAVRRAREELAEPPIGADGRLQEWSEEFEEPEPGHRHLSHLYGLYPGHQVDPISTPELAEAISRSLEARIAGGSPDGGWTHSWMAALYARLFDAEKANWVITHLVQLNRIGPALSYRSRRDIHQIDANLGVGAAISEMLLQSHRDVVRPLPAIPRSWRSGRYRGLRARGGLTVAVEWQEDRGLVELVADRPGEHRVAFPDAPSQELVVSMSAGRPWRKEFSLGR